MDLSIGYYQNNRYIPFSYSYYNSPACTHTSFNLLTLRIRFKSITISRCFNHALCYCYCCCCCSCYWLWIGHIVIDYWGGSTWPWGGEGWIKNGALLCLRKVVRQLFKFIEIPVKFSWHRLPACLSACSYQIELMRHISQNHNTHTHTYTHAHLHTICDLSRRLPIKSQFISSSSRRTCSY